MTPFRRARVDSFLFEFKRWATSETGIHGVALIGSHARNAATDESDVDLIVVISPPNVYLKHKQWISLFGSVDREQVEDYGKCTSLRVWYTDGLEVEYGFVDETWAAYPDSPQIVSNGIKILFERRGVMFPSKPLV